MSTRAFAAPTPVTAEPPKLRTVEGRAPLVLLVEDHRVNQLLGKALLERLGCRVEVAHHGEEAVRMVRRRGFDLVLMDLLMPVMDGIEATRRLRATGAAVPIVALTASSEEGDGLREAGFTACLAKPASPGTLRAAIARVLTGSACR
jgi:two-component system capsular synthesis sensor histidine kinase RcsC